MRAFAPLRVTAIAAALVSVCFSLPASAEVERWLLEKDASQMIFKDDPLHSGVEIPYGANIEVRPTPYRVMLIRPRTSYVPEMLKSVENI
jgi:hypothetical protein